MPSPVQQVRFLTNIAAASPTPTDMLLPVFGGEVLVAYMNHLQFTNKVNHRTIATGVEAKFPATWKVSSDIHQAGELILGSDVATREYSIYLDSRPRVASFEVDDIDEMLAHFDVRSPLSQASGQELAEQVDKNIAKLLIKASRTAGTTPFPGGGIDQNGTAATDTAFTANVLTIATAAAAQAFLNVIERTVIVWDQNNVPTNDRYAVCRPELWYALRRLGTLISGSGYTFGGTNAQAPAMGNKDWDSVNPQINKFMSKDEYLLHLGVQIYRSTFVPGTNTTGLEDSKYAGDYTKTLGIIWQKDAIAHLQKLGIVTETGRDIRAQGDLVIAKTMTGGGTLRPVCAVEVITQ